MKIALERKQADESIISERGSRCNNEDDDGDADDDDDDDDDDDNNKNVPARPGSGP